MRRSRRGRSEVLTTNFAPFLTSNSQLQVPNFMALFIISGPFLGNFCACQAGGRLPCGVPSIPQFPLSGRFHSIQTRHDPKTCKTKTCEFLDHRKVGKTTLEIPLMVLHSRLSFPATGHLDPGAEIFKPWEAERIITFDTFLKGFRRVLEGVLKGFWRGFEGGLKGPSTDPSRGPGVL